MVQDLKIIRQFLNHLRVRSALLNGLELFLLASTLLMALVLGGAALGSLEVSHQALLVAFAASGLLLPVVWALVVTWPRHRRFHRPESAAREVDRQLPELRNGTLSALELSPGARHLDGLSDDLIVASVKQAARQVMALSPARLLPVRPIRPWLLSFLATSAVLLACVTWMPGRLEAALARFLNPPVDVPASVAAPVLAGDDGPALGDITLKLVYPAYLERENELLENASGELLAPRGTQVTISARASVIPATAQLQVTGQPSQEAKVEVDGRFSAVFVVDAKASWRFAIAPTGGGAAILSKSYPIEIEVDAVPTVVVSGLQDGMEVVPSQPLPFGYQAQDDHGLTRVDLVVEGPKGARRKLLQEVPRGRDRDEGQVAFYPAEWELEEGGTVTVFLEARDNDTVSGPKVGRSDRYKLVVSSAARRREQALAGKEALKEALIAALGDSLVQQDAPARDKIAATYSQELGQLSEDMKKVSEGFNQLRQLMEQDSLEQATVYRATLALEESLMAAWELTENSLKTLSRGGPDLQITLSERELFDQRASLITLLERGILSLESFANLQRMESILSRTENMRKAGESLRDMLDELKKSGKKPDMAELMKKLSEMQQQLAALAQEMGQLDQSSAEWYQNPAGEAQEVKDSLEEIRELLAQGKTEEAMQKLEEYLKATSELEKSLKEMQDQEFGGVQDQMVKDMAGAIDGLKDMESQQRKLLGDTQATRNAMARQAGVTPEAMKKLTADALNKLETMRQAVDKTAEEVRNSGADGDRGFDRHVRELKDQLQTLEAALKAQDLQKSHRQATDAMRGFRYMEVDLSLLERDSRSDLKEARASQRQGAGTAQKLVQDLEGMLEKMDRMQDMSTGQGQGLASRQESIRQKGEAMGQRLKEYSKDSPMIPGSWGERAERASKSMQSAEGKLSGGELRAGEGDEEIALQELGELRKELEQAQKEMSQRMKQSAQGGARPGERRGGQGQPQSNERWGDQGVKTGKVDISKDFKAPEERRREIMEGMKGETPERYKRLNRDYYEKLVR